MMSWLSIPITPSAPLILLCTNLCKTEDLPYVRFILFSRARAIRALWWMRLLTWRPLSHYVDVDLYIMALTLPSDPEDHLFEPPTLLRVDWTHERFQLIGNSFERKMTARNIEALKHPSFRAPWHPSPEGSSDPPRAIVDLGQFVGTLCVRSTPFVWAAGPNGDSCERGD
jgi:hypothetical protein